MDNLTLYDKSRAIRIYEEVRGVDEDGQVFTRVRKYEESCSVEDPFKERAPKHRMSADGLPDTLTLMYLNSLAVFVLVVVFVLNMIMN